MQHEQLVAQGLDDIIDGNESYAQRYMQGQYFANDIVSLSDVNGMEGIFQAIWEKIKQFCAWIAGLFSSKKETGSLTKEVGVKPSLPKADRKVVKVTRVPAKQIKAEMPAPKAKAPTESEKAADQVKMQIDKFVQEMRDKYQNHEEETPAVNKEPELLVSLIMKPQNLGVLYKSLGSIHKAFSDDYHSLLENYKTTVKMFNELKGVPESIINAMRPDSVEEFERRWKRPLDLIDKFKTVPSSYDSISIDQINRIADQQISEICSAVESVIENKKLTSMDVGWKNHKKEDVLKYFEGMLKGVHEEADKAAFGKVLIRLVRLDYSIWSMYDSTDALSKIKQRIKAGEFFVRAPNV